MLGAGLVFILTNNIVLLMAAAIIGVISPSGNEIGPFLSVEQAGLTQIIPNEKRTNVFAWYNLVGSFATATGALSGGWLAQILQGRGWTALDSYKVVLSGYAHRWFDPGDIIFNGIVCGRSEGKDFSRDKTSFWGCTNQGPL